MDEEYEYEEERAIVMVELQGVFDSEALLKGQQSIKILGLDSDEPILQIGNCIFAGEYEDTIGTTVFFDKQGESSYVCKTDKKLAMKRVFLEKKCESAESTVTKESAQETLLSDEVAISIKKVTTDNNSSLDHDTNHIKEFSELTKNPSTNGIKTVAEESNLLESKASDRIKENITTDSGSAENDIYRAPIDANITETEIQLDTTAAISSNNNASVQQQTEQCPKKGTEESEIELVAANGNVISEQSYVSFDSSTISECEISIDIESEANIPIQNDYVIVDESDTSRESEDLVIMSEAEESNEAQCDNGNSPVSEFTHVRPSTLMQVDSSNVHTASSTFSNQNTNHDLDESLSVPVSRVLSSLVSEIHSALPTGSSEDVADSASHLIGAPTVRLSDSSISNLCDSVSGNAISALHNVSANALENSVGDLTLVHNGQHISTSNYLNAIDTNENNSDDVFIEEPMEIIVIDSEEVVVVDDDDSNFVESDSYSQDVGAEAICLESEGAVSNSSAQSSVNNHQDIGSAINSTVNEVTGSTYPAGISIDVDETGSSSSSNNTNINRTTKDSVDSTSNQMFHSGQNYESYKPITGIDSTTNDSGGKLSLASVDSQSNLTVASSSASRNDTIDSTLNASAEGVDFEMREARNPDSADDADCTINVRASDGNQSIDSTSNSTRTAFSHNIAESSENMGRLPEVLSDEVSESCSESRNDNQIAESSHSSGSNIYHSNTNYDPDDNSICRVSESHIDDRNIELQSAHIDYPNSEVQHIYPNQASAVSESLQPEGSESSEVMDFSENVIIDSNFETSYRTNPSSSDVSASCSRSQDVVTQNLSSSPSCSSSYNISEGMSGQQIRSTYEDLGEYESESHRRQLSQSSSRYSNMSTGQVTASSEIQHSFHTSNTEDDSDEVESVASIVTHSSQSDSANDSIKIDDAENQLFHNVSSSGRNDNESMHNLPNVNDTEPGEYSEADALNKVSEPVGMVQEVARRVEPCASSSGLPPTSDGSRSDVSVIYPSHEPNDSEVTESSAANSRIYSVEETNESEAKNMNSFEFAIPGSSISSEIRFSQPCGSSDEQHTSTGKFLYTEESSGSDSRPSSSKEVIECNIDQDEIIYDIADSPETDSPNDPCTSSSNKSALNTRMGMYDNPGNPESEDLYESDILGCCSTSGNHQGIKTSELIDLCADEDNLQQNEAEAEVAECSGDNDDDDVLYIDIDSPDASGSVTESCASSSNREATMFSAQRNFPETNMDASDAGERSLPHEVSEFDEEISRRSRPQETVRPSHSRIQSSAYFVSDSSDICTSPNLELSSVQDDSSCEVTESHVQNSSNSESLHQSAEQRNEPHSFPMLPNRMNTSPSSTDGASTSHGIVSSRHWKNISSTSFKEPSPSDINVSSASDVAGRSASSIPVSSQHYRSDSSEDSSGSGGSESSSDEDELLHIDVDSAENQVSDSLNENPADSTGDGASSFHNSRNRDQRVEGTDNSKLPSSTSN